MKCSSRTRTSSSMAVYDLWKLCRGRSRTTCPRPAMKTGMSNVDAYLQDSYGVWISMEDVVDVAKKIERMKEKNANPNFVFYA